LHHFSEKNAIKLERKIVIELYGSNFSRAVIVQWYLEELSIPYKFTQVEILKGEHLQPAYMALQPFAKVPAIDDDGFILWESGAILSYLAHKYGNVNTPEKLAIVNQWIFFANTTLSDGLLAPHLKEKETPHLLGILNEMFAKQPYLMGQEFSVADVATGVMLSYAGMLMKGLDLSPYHHIVAYLELLRARPAFPETMKPLLA
jgi:glutathione S-transferase